MVRALIVCTLVACMAACAEAVALTCVWFGHVRKHLEQAHPVVQVVKLGVDASDDWLCEFGESVFEVLNETQCHWNHDICDHVRGGMFTAFHFARGANALLVFVDLCELNLLNANDHFEMIIEFIQQHPNG